MLTDILINSRQDTSPQKTTNLEYEAAAKEAHFMNRKENLSQGIENFEFKENTRVILFSREISDVGTEVTFFTSTENNPLRASFFVPNEYGLVLDLFHVIDYTVNTGFPPGPPSYEYSLAMNKQLSINLRQLLNKCPLTALNTETLVTINSNPKLVKFIEDHYIGGRNIQELTVSDEIKSIFGSEEGLVIPATTPTNLVHAVYTDLRNW